LFYKSNNIVLYTVGKLMKLYTTVIQTMFSDSDVKLIQKLSTTESGFRSQAEQKLQLATVITFNPELIMR